VYSGTAAIDFLAAELDQIDPGESSHWVKYHSSFQYTGAGFRGLQGFGGFSKPRGNLLNFIETLLQLKFRALAEGKEFSVLDSLAAEIAESQNRNYDLDLLRQVLTLSFLRHRLPDLFETEGGVGCVIGDGFASMTSLLLASNSASKVILVNLNKTLLVDLWYLRLWMGDELFDTNVDLVGDEDDLHCALEKPINRSDDIGQVIAIRAVDHALIRKSPIDLVINIASMQEMDPSVISGYFMDLRKSSSRRPLYFYCCNRDEKILPDGATTRFYEYPWAADDQILVDELCPWHKYYYSFKPPFFRSYDGTHPHRLAILAKLSQSF
jgi:hypothetical protein